jgi:hypothetical protein
MAEFCTSKLVTDAHDAVRMPLLATQTMQNAQVSLTVVASLPYPLLPLLSPHPPLRRIWIYPSSWSAAAALTDVHSSHRLGCHDPWGKLHRLKLCVWFWICE